MNPYEILNQCQISIYDNLNILWNTGEQWPQPSVRKLIIIHKSPHYYSKHTESFIDQESITLEDSSSFHCPQILFQPRY